MDGWLTLAGVVFTALVSLAGVIYSNKATRKVVLYRVDQLEKKVEKHNNVIERVYKLEQKVDDLEKKVG